MSSVSKLLVLAGLALAAPAATAQAATLGDASGVRYTAASGERNQVTAALVGERYVVTDDGARIEVEGSCSLESGSDGHRASCPLPPARASEGCFFSDPNGTRTPCPSGRPPSLNIDLGDESDTAEASLPAAPTDTSNPNFYNQSAIYMTGGAGDDALTGSDANTVWLQGGPGADVLVGRGDAARLSGQEDGDRLVTDAWRQSDVDGGDGDDVLTANGAGNSTILAGAGDDRVTGNDVVQVSPSGDPPERIDGGAGDDSIEARGGYEIVVGGDGADRIASGAGPAWVEAGGGDDVVYGGTDPSRLLGEGGADEIHGGASDDWLLSGGDGDDSVDGGAGNDQIETDPGADLLSGGEGVRDTVSYLPRTAPLAISFNGVADDGELGEGDRVADDVESVEGGAGPDILTGSSRGEYLFGAAGADRLTGGGGFDVLLGGSGDDVIDAVDGAASGSGETSSHFYFAVPADDVIVCGASELGDTALIDMADDVDPHESGVTDCENVVLPFSTVHVPRTGALKLQTRCPKSSAAGCEGVATVQSLPGSAPRRAGAARARAVLGRGRFKIPAGRRARVSIPLSKAGRRALAARARVPASVRFTVRGAAGKKPILTTRKLVLRRSARPR